jgi:sulfatase maturation enzyme AslB (radical SAM superfamily)
MGKDLKAENLTISIPDRGCNKHCPYCVARMTGKSEENYDLMLRNIKKIAHIAKLAEVTSVLFTGKGEPILDDTREILEKLSEKFSDWPLEIQTNGISLLMKKDWVDFLYNINFNVIAISVDTNQQLDDMKVVFQSIYRKGLVSRMTLNITSLINPSSFEEILKYCHENHIRQLTIRKIIAPENPKDKKAAEWIAKNVNDKDYQILVTSAMNYVRQKGTLIRTTTDGLNIWDCEDVSFAHSDYCIQESNKSSDIRSLIFAEDGHLYTSWNSKASILF